MSAPIRFDANSVTFEGDRGLLLLSMIVTKAKFGDSFDREMILSPSVSEISVKIQEFLNSKYGKTRDIEFETTVLNAAALVLFENSEIVEWRNKNIVEREVFIRDNVMSPHNLKDSEVVYIINRVEELADHYRNILDALGNY